MLIYPYPMTNPVKNKYTLLKDISKNIYLDNTAKQPPPLHVAMTVQSRWRPPGRYLT
jgi:hypothetical protein